MSDRPLVSVIIPTYNRASLVGSAIDSVRQQTYPNVEIIVVDDGSTDDTPATLQAYGDAVRVIRQENAGPSAARNSGLRAARGEIVAFLDSDDMWRPAKLERQVRLFVGVGESLACCLCNATMLGPVAEGGTTFDYAGLAPTLEEGIWENVTEVLATRFVLFTQAVAVRRAVLERLNGFNEELDLMEDYDLALRLSLEGPWGYIREPLVLYKQGSPGSLTAAAQTDAARVTRCSLSARQGLYERVRKSERHAHLRRKCYKALQALRRESRAVHWSLDQAWPYALLGRCALRLNRYRRAVYRRSPWFPKMKVSRVGASDSVPERPTH